MKDATYSATKTTNPSVAKGHRSALPLMRTVASTGRRVLDDLFRDHTGWHHTVRSGHGEGRSGQILFDDDRFVVGWITIQRDWEEDDRVCFGEFSPTGLLTGHLSATPWFSQKGGSGLHDLQ